MMSYPKKAALIVVSDKVADGSSFPKSEGTEWCERAVCDQNYRPRNGALAPCVPDRQFGARPCAWGLDGARLKYSVARKARVTRRFVVPVVPVVPVVVVVVVLVVVVAAGGAVTAATTFSRASHNGVSVILYSKYCTAE